MEPVKVEVQSEGQMQQLYKVTPLSKYLAMALFIIMPFLGGYVGYAWAPDRVVEVERVVFKETLNEYNGSSYGVDYPTSHDFKKILSRKETQRIALGIQPFSEKNLTFEITAYLEPNQIPNYIDNISFDKNNGMVLLDKQSMVRVHELHPESTIQQSIFDIRLQQLAEKGVTKEQLLQDIQEYLKLHPEIEKVDSSYEAVCTMYSWESMGNTLHMLIPADTQTGTHLAEMCGYTKFVSIENLLIENFAISLDGTEPQVTGGITLLVDKL